MACCVVLMAVVAHFFAWRRRIRRALGLPVETWDEEGDEPRFTQVWRSRFRTLTRSKRGRAGLSAAVLAELTFLVVALPGPNGLIAAHREHYRELVNFVASVGRSTEAVFCGPFIAP